MMRNTVFTTATNIAKKCGISQKLLPPPPVLLKIAGESTTEMGYMKETTIQIIENGAYNETASAEPVESVSRNSVEDINTTVIGIIESNIYDSK